ncbi:NAD-dependent protein deacylase [Mediannikoviicoccus vaginalis]|uniref:NAD-dependent protein deacylase n=1 Tax=Mediannikoviicoccus vaginalis TaxID=2899727 RepID=UPI001F00AFFE|nr:NAD-dependent protein deacylase [Mediannikoviicoccus vaginalis]
MTSNNIDKLKEIIKKSNNIVFFGGAGVSTASGIPDFRSATGLYNEKNNKGYSPEYMLSHEFFSEHPREFMDYVRNNLIYEEAKPNKCHLALKKLEDMGKLKGIVTQNIDSLHQLAGSKNVVEIHGNLRDYHCVNCGKYLSFEDMKERDFSIKCPNCGGVLRPDVVLYGEALDLENINNAINLIENAEILIVGGSSLMVYPAAGFIDYFRGDTLVLINKTKTSYDSRADFVFYEDIGNTMSQLANI